jgi:hypothetical protein
MRNSAKIAVIAVILLGLMLVLVPIVLEAGFGIVALPPL